MSISTTIHIGSPEELEAFAKFCTEMAGIARRHNEQMHELRYANQAANSGVLGLGSIEEQQAGKQTS